MFKSKFRPIIIPQSEHARLAGLLAYFWGNEMVAPPPIHRLSFVSGVTHHDRGYGLIDTIGIGEVDDAIWLATQKRGLLQELADPTAEAVALHHIRRLLNFADADYAAEVIALAEQHIEQTVHQTPYPRETFQQADTITDFCDMVSFTFCFEQPKQFEKIIRSQGKTTTIKIHILEAGQIALDPYPLAIPELRGFILGYEAAGYPDHLQPISVEYLISALQH